MKKKKNWRAREREQKKNNNDAFLYSMYLYVIYLLEESRELGSNDAEQLKLVVRRGRKTNCFVRRLSSSPLGQPAFDRSGDESVRVCNWQNNGVVLGRRMHLIAGSFEQCGGIKIWKTTWFSDSPMVVESRGEKGNGRQLCWRWRVKGRREESRAAGVAGGGANKFTITLELEFKTKIRRTTSLIITRRSPFPPALHGLSIRQRRQSLPAAPVLLVHPSVAVAPNRIATTTGGAARVFGAVHDAVNSIK